MKRSVLVICAAILSGWAIMAWAENAQNTPDPAVAQKMGYRALANGAIIYEETAEDANASIEEISPAAGGTEADPNQPQFKYDPLTQTYRRVIVDQKGNIHNDIVNTNDK